MYTSYCFNISFKLLYNNGLIMETEYWSLCVKSTFHFKWFFLKEISDKSGSANACNVYKEQSFLKN